MERKEFKAESKRLLDLMINSIYTHKEIFLREIISNASDAIDKLCYLSLTDDKVGISRDEFAIKLVLDKEKRLLTVSDNGIGMDRDELENNLGVIASSGSLRFRQEMDGEAAADTDIIGQFGVGFYSAFMVSDEITVITRKYGQEQAWRWQSAGVDGYTIEPCEKETVGTDIIMHIKEDGEEKDEYSQYLREYPLYKLVKKYSDYIRFPIRMEMPHPVLKEGGTEENPEYEEKFEWETLNSMVPLWQRKKGDVTKEEYDEFYQQRFSDPNPPLSVITVSAEGAVTYKAMLFIPSKANGRYYTEDYESGLQLYSAGVMIMDKCADLVPECFNFVRGVVDSPDLNLNISRDQGGAGAAAAGREGEVRAVLAELRPPAENVRAGQLWRQEGDAAGSAAVLLLHGEEAGDADGVCRPHAGGAEVYLLRLRRHGGGHRPHAADGTAEGAQHGDPVLHRQGG